MGSMTNKQEYTAPVKGRNDKLSPLMVGRDEAVELTNFVVNDRGILDKIEGFTKDGAPFPNDADSFIRMLLNYKRGITVDDLLMAAQDDGNTNASYKVDFKRTGGDGTYSYIGHTAGTSASFTNGSTAVTGVGTSWLSHLKAGDKIKATSHSDTVYAEISSVTNDTTLVLTANYSGATVAAVAYTARIILHKDFVPRSVVFNNKAVITNGSEKPMTWDNTTMNIITDAQAPRAKFVEAHKSRVFMAATTGNPSRIFWSAVNDEQTWDAASYEDVFPQDNGTIVAIKSFGDSLIVLKNSGNIYQVIGNFDDSDVGEVEYIRKIDTPEGIGAISERSAAVLENTLYFLTETGVYQLDARMFVQKISYQLDDFLSGTSFALGPSSSKVYTYDTQAQWATGTNTDGKISSGGIFSNYFDSTEASGVYTASGTVPAPYAVTMDSSYNLHIAYTDSADNTKVKYKKILASDNSVSVDETVVDESVQITGLSISVASNGTVGIAYCSAIAAPLFLKYTEKASTTWSSADTLASDMSFLYCISLSHNSSNDPRVAASEIVGGSYYTRYYRRVTAVWATKQVVTAAAYPITKISMVLASSQPRIVIMRSTDGVSYRLEYYKSVDDGDNWTNPDNHSVTNSASFDFQLSLDGANVISGFYTSTGFNTRSHDAGTTDTSMAAATSGLYFLGFKRYNSKNYWLAGSLNGDSLTEKQIHENSVVLTSPSSDNLSRGTVGINGYLTQYKDRAFDNVNGVFCHAAPSSSANVLSVRRVSYRAVWTGPETSDSTLTAWGTYDVSGQVNNSATVLHEVALATASPASAFSTITSGAVISSDATKVFVIPRITMTLGTFASPEVGSVVLNYTGAGVDAKQAVSLAFDNELYLAIAKNSDTANANILLRDADGAWMLTTYPVSSMCRYKKRLYAGKSTNGDLIVLRNGYKFDTVAYEAEFISKEDFLGSIDLEKDIYKIYALFEVKDSGSFDFSYRLDNFKNASEEAWVTETVDQTSKGIHEVHIGQKAHTIQFRVQNDNLDESVGFIGVVIVYGTLNQR